RWVDDRTWVVRTEGGEVAGFHGVVLDVTDRVRVQEALRESERMFSKLFRMSPMGIIIHRISDGRAVLVNDAFVQILGYDHEEIIGRRAEDVGALVEPEAREHWMATLRDEGSVHGVYATIRKRSGEPRHVLASMQLVVLEGEVMVMVLAEDVTDRRRVEEEARRARERLEEAMDLAHMASWDYDRGTREFTFNDRLYALCGTSAAAEGGYRMTFDAYRDRFVAAPDQARVGEELRRALSNPDPNHVARMEHRLVRPDGQERHVVVRFVMERDAQGDVIRTHGVNQDITERKRAEAAAEINYERWKLANHSTQDGLWDWNIPAQTVSYSDSWARMLGFSLSELSDSQDEWYQRVHPDDRHITESSLNDVLSGRAEDYTAAHRLRCKDGSWKWVLGRGAVL
ncbi:MAG: PAS domain S-box protein, partial [Myxococcales bacterium]|nr:PAS domain S-box protein [Myxococcales bacterium]